MDWLFRYADPSIDWHYALITLTVRFVGVFVVMFVMQIALQVSAFAVRRLERWQAGRDGSAAGAEPIPAAVAVPSDVDEEMVVAIGLALALESRLAPSRPAGTSAWAVAGRLAQLDRLRRR